MRVKKRTHLIVVAVFSFIFLLLLNLIPSMNASAAIKTYPVIACTGGKVSYYNSSVSYFSGNSNVSIYCSSKGSFTITVNPNTSTSSRTITLYAKNSKGTTLDTLKITQSGVPTKNLSAPCTGGNVYYTKSGASSYSYSNTAVCNSRSGNYFVVKASTSTSSRSCKVTVKNSAGRVIEYVTINQSAVPTKNLSAPCTGDNVYYTKSGASSYSYSNTAVCNSRSGNYFVVKPNETTSSRSCKVTVKNSAGRIIEYVTINQAAVLERSIQIAGNNAKYFYYNTKASVFDSSCISKTTASNLGDFTIYFYNNPSLTNSRKFDIIVKNGSGARLEIIHVEQAVCVWTSPVKHSDYRNDAPSAAYKSSRSSGVPHGGIDFYPADSKDNSRYGSDGTPKNVYAMADGEVVAISNTFYEGTSAVLVKHGDYYVIYGEIQTRLKVGSKIVQGQTIGIMKKSNANTLMLHLEILTKNYPYNYIANGSTRQNYQIDPTFVYGFADYK